jgi:hypothetical protein
LDPVKQNAYTFLLQGLASAVSRQQLRFDKLAM